MLHCTLVLFLFSAGHILWSLKIRNNESALYFAQTGKSSTESFEMPRESDGYDAKCHTKDWEASSLPE